MAAKLINENSEPIGTGKLRLLFLSTFLLGCHTVNLNEDKANGSDTVPLDASTRDANAPPAADTDAPAEDSEPSQETDTTTGEDTALTDSAPSPDTGTEQASDTEDSETPSTYLPGTDTGTAVSDVEAVRDTATATSSTDAVDSDSATWESTDDGTDTGSEVDTGATTDTVEDVSTTTDTESDTHGDTETDTGTATALDAGTPLDTGSDSGSGSGTGFTSGTLLHRWSFDGQVLSDAVGGSDAAVMTAGDGSGGAVSYSDTQVIMAGGDGATSQYISLGTGLLAGIAGPLTVELWATLLSDLSWTRIFEFGSSEDHYLNMLWSEDELANNRAAWQEAPDGEWIHASNSDRPYAIGDGYHIVMTIHPGGGDGNTTRVTWYAAPSDSSDLSDPVGTFDTGNTLAALNDTHCWLGKSHFSQNATANAGYNEVRIWSGALSPSDLEKLHDWGPNRVAP
jgi:hypothetical protein